MARLPRITPAGMPVHIIQRGNNRQVCYNYDEEGRPNGEWQRLGFNFTLTPVIAFMPAQNMCGVIYGTSWA